MNKRIQNQIAAADTPAKVWELVESLLSDGNEYAPEVYLENAKAWTAIARKMEV